MRNISIRLTETQLRELARAARRIRMTRSQVIREAIEVYIRRSGAISCLTATEDLAGCVEGAVDLSHNPEFMKKYGEAEPHDCPARIVRNV